MTKTLKNFLIGSVIAGTVLSAGIVFANDQTTADNKVVAPKTTATMRKTLDITCMAAAVGKREAAVSTAFGAKSSAVSAAFSKRASDLAAAWAITTAKDRNAAIKAAWKAFNGSATTAHKAYRTANIAAWKAFRTDAKACAGSMWQDYSQQGTDNNL